MAPTKKPAEPSVEPAQPAPPPPVAPQPVPLAPEPADPITVPEPEQKQEPAARIQPASEPAALQPEAPAQPLAAAPASVEPEAAARPAKVFAAPAVQPVAAARPAADPRPDVVRPAADPVEQLFFDPATDGAGRDGGSGGRGSGGGRTPRRRSVARIVTWVVVLVIFAGIVGGGVTVWVTQKDRVLSFIGKGEPDDYTGAGTGKVTVVIKEGDIGSDVASALKKDDVVKTSGAFYSLLLSKDPDSVVFQPGAYSLKKHMSSSSALKALMDDKNRVETTAVIPEGTTLKGVYQILSSATGIPVKQFTRAGEDPSAYGVPKKFPSLEGYVFPATYTFLPDTSATKILQTLVDRMNQSLDDDGVSRADSWRVLTLASIVQREGGAQTSDFYKIARVFQNRLDDGMNLQSDATVAYGTGNLDTVWTTDAERANAKNGYNTYANPGLPIGPIGAPGDTAIDAALHPKPGSWLFFVPVNLKTGETVFSTTDAEHSAAVAQLHAWCAVAANAKYCV